MDGSMTRFYVLFNSISVISGRWFDDNERLCAMELCLRLRRISLEDNIQLFHAFTANSQNYRSRGCGRPDALLPEAASPKR